jgi:hypothetical protein
LVFDQAMANGFRFGVGLHDATLPSIRFLATFTD